MCSVVWELEARRSLSAPVWSLLLFFLRLSWCIVLFVLVAVVVVLLALRSAVDGSCGAAWWAVEDSGDAEAEAELFSGDEAPCVVYAAGKGCMPPFVSKLSNLDKSALEWASGRAGRSLGVSASLRRSSLWVNDTHNHLEAGY